MSLLVLAYCMLMLFYALRFKAFRFYELKKDLPPKTNFSIIIPFRNEAEYLPQLLKSLSELKYPKNQFEIFLVNDHSEDDSKSICDDLIENLGLKNASTIDNQNLAKSPKKSAILSALSAVKGDYLITTDADCLLPQDWLRHYDMQIQDNPADLVAGPVKIIENNKFWTKFQVLDMMSLQVIGLGSFKTPTPLLCNAANLCYKVETLLDIEAFEAHKDIVSGDDIFNLESFQKSNKSVKAIVHPDVTVWTKAESHFNDLTQQRIRWASKAKFYKNKWLIILGLIVLLTNLSLVSSLVFAFASESFQHFWWLWIFKISVDFCVLYIGNQFFKASLCLREYIIIMLIYPFVSSYFGVLSLDGKFNWKGRKYMV
jgi:cellulose synthase/poly-beta-1,6-N-acetylglucosamine synthase-like glycosyltransferase